MGLMRKAGVLTAATIAMKKAQKHGATNNESKAAALAAGVAAYGA